MEFSTELEEISRLVARLDKLPSKQAKALYFLASRVYISGADVFLDDATR